MDTILVLVLLAAISGGRAVSGASDGFTAYVKSEVRKIGANVTLHCIVNTNGTTGSKAQSNPGPFAISWSFTPVGLNTSRIILQASQSTASPTGSRSSTSSGIAGPVDTPTYYTAKYVRTAAEELTVVRITTDDAGKYTCSLMDLHLEASGQLYVIDKGLVCTNNTGKIFYENDNETLSCGLNYHGNHAPNLDWQLSRSLQVSFYHDLRTSEHNTPQMSSSSLHLILPPLIDGKHFTCMVKFENVSDILSCTTMFPPDSIQYQPFISHIHTHPSTQEGNHLAELGTKMTLYCGGHGNPKPSFHWKFYSEEHSEDNNKSSNLPCNRTACVLHNLTTDSQGTYVCKVTNTVRGQANSASKSIFLKVVDTTPAGYITSTQAPDSSTSLPSETENSGKGVSPYAIGAIVCASLAIALIIVFIFLALKMRTRERRLHERLTRMHDENLDDQEVELLDENIQPDNVELPAEYGRLKQQFEIPRKDIRLVDLIAKGTFVEVWRGRMRKYPRRNDIMKVAIKRITSEATEKERKFFLAELEVIKAIQPHSNVIPLIGCYTGSDPWLVMVEYATEGSLYQFLQHRRPGDLRVEIHSENSDSVSLKNQNLTSHRLLSLAAQVVNGLQHINRFKMIYYRLRAAGVLVCKGGICKLSGFGFVPDITERNLYEMNSAPVRWMSPETLLDNVYNVKTDVWSFGILLWEIVHFGHLPYPDMGPHEVSEKIQTGYRMPQPPHCSGDIYNLMLMCWAQSPENRPSFGDIMQNLTHLAEYSEGHININNLPEGLKSSDIVENTSALA